MPESSSHPSSSSHSPSSHVLAAEFLSALPLFRDLTPGQLEEARRVLHQKELRPGYVLMTEEQPGEIAYLIVHGSVKVCLQGRDNDIIVTIRGPGELVGELSVLDGIGRSATVITQEPTTVLWVARNDFWNTLWEMPPIPYNLTCILTQRLRVLSAQTLALASLDVQGRLARQLVLLAEEYGYPAEAADGKAPAPAAATIATAPRPTAPGGMGPGRASAPCRAPSAAGGGSGPLIIPFHLTQSELASMIGSTREQVNQLLSTWRRRRYIRIEESHLTVYDRIALRRLYE